MEALTEKDIQPLIEALKNDHEAVDTSPLWSLDDDVIIGAVGQDAEGTEFQFDIDSYSDELFEVTLWRTKEEGVHFCLGNLIYNRELDTFI